MEYLALILDMGFIFNFRASLLGVNIREQSYMRESSSFVIEHNFDQVPSFIHEWKCEETSVLDFRLE